MRTTTDLLDGNGRLIQNKVFTDQDGNEHVKRHGMIGHLELVSDVVLNGNHSQRRVITKRVAYYTNTL